MLNTRVSSAKSALVCLMIVARALTNTSGVAAQSGDPSSLPLLSSGGLEYLGGFRVPAETVNGLGFAYGGQAVAYDPSTNSLYISSRGSVAEVSIPTPVNSSDVNAMPFASFLQPFEDPTEGHLREVFDGDVKMDGLMVYGNRLYGTGYIYFDASNEQRVSHYSRSRQLNQPSFSGWSQVWESGRSGFVAGMMAAVPSEWQAKLGGPALTGQCCIPIIWRTSSGPSALTFDPTKIGQASVNATALLYYPQEHPTLGSWSDVATVNPPFNMGTEISGMVVLAGTRTVLYFGRTGVGKGCYGSGTGDLSLVGTIPPGGGEPYCYDPTSPYKGAHAYPYRYQMWAYDLNDFAAVKAGTKQPWDVVPYGVWPLNLPTPEATVRLGGVGYDSQRQLLYVSQLRGDPDGQERPLIHTFRVNATPGAAPAPSNYVSSVTLTADKPAPQAVGTPVTFTAQPAGGVAPYQYKWIVSNGNASTVAVNWTTSNRFTWTPTADSASYAITVWVRSAGNAADVLEATTYLVYPVGNTTNTGAAISVSMTANRVAPQAPFTAITWTATPAGGGAPHQYKWRVFDGTAWTVSANWSPTNSFVWTPSAANPNYRVEVWLRSAGSSADAPEASTASAFPIAPAGANGAVSSVSLTSNRTAPQPIGNAIGFTATPTGGTAPFVYKWFVFDGSNWTLVVNWDSNATFGWTPTVANANYRVRVWVKAASYYADQPEASGELPFAITSDTAPSTPVSSVKLIANKPAPHGIGTPITFTATPSGGTAPLVYKWSVSGGASPITTGWGGSNTFTWTPTTAGNNYRVTVSVKRASNAADQAEATDEQRFNINNGKR